MNIYARGLDLIGTMDQNGNMTSYYIENYRGDVARITDANGNITRANFYDEFGNDISTTPADSGFLYAGEYWDANSGTYYLCARSYNPGIGRFVQRDSYPGEEGNPTSSFVIHLFKVNIMLHGKNRRSY